MRKLIIIGSIAALASVAIAERPDRGQRLERLAERVLHLVQDFKADLSKEQRQDVRYHLREARRIILGQDGTELGRGRLSCYSTHRGSYLPGFRGEPLIGDNTGYGFSKRSTCEQMVDNAQNGLICSWNGRTRLVYRTSDGQPVLGHDDYKGGYGSGDACNKAVTGSSRDLVCLWNGTIYERNADNSIKSSAGYTPYNIRTGKVITRYENIATDGTAKGGFSTQEGCNEVIARHGHNTVCTWSGNRNVGYQTINFETGEVYASFGGTATDKERCIRAARHN